MDRERLYRILEPAYSGDKVSKAYDYFMMVVIACSLAHMFTHSPGKVIIWIDIVTCVIFIIEYLLRWSTADICLRKKGIKGVKAFLVYPFTPMAIVDLLSILPTISLISPAFKILRTSRLLRIFRLFKFMRYYEPVRVIRRVIRRESKTLMTVLVCAAFYILACALVMFNVESDPFFDTFFDALYWSCCTLTTVGYGDIYPVSTIGRAFSMLSSLVGIALIAMPSGIITSAYLDELRKKKARTERKMHTRQQG